MLFFIFHKIFLFQNLNCFASESYADNMQCDYTVHVARGSSITLQLIDIAMEITPDCSYDYVAVS